MSRHTCNQHCIRGEGVPVSQFLSLIVASNNVDPKFAVFSPSEQSVLLDKLYRYCALPTRNFTKFSTRLSFSIALFVGLTRNF